MPFKGSEIGKSQILEELAGQHILQGYLALVGNLGQGSAYKGYFPQQH